MNYELRIKKYEIKKIILLFLICNLFLAPFSFAEEKLSNTGLVKSGIWYSKDPFFAGDKVRVYTIVFNGSKYDLLGTVNFENNGKVICKGDFSAVAGRTQEFWCDFTATKGDTKIIAKIIDPRIAPVGGSPTPIVLENNVSGTSERYIDTDINKNGIADKTDISKGIDPKIPIILKDTSFDLKTSTSSSATGIGAEVEKAVSDVNDQIFSVVPKGAISEKIEAVKNTMLSYLPENVKKEAQNLSDKAQAYSVIKPFDAIFNLLIAVIVFVKNSAMATFIISFGLIWFVLKSIYARVTKRY